MRKHKTHPKALLFFTLRVKLRPCDLYVLNMYEKDKNLTSAPIRFPYSLSKCTVTLRLYLWMATIKKH